MRSRPMAALAAKTRYGLKENEAECRERLRAFWAGESLGRPCVVARVQKPGFAPRPWTGPALTGKEMDNSVEWHVHGNSNMLAQHEYCGEAMPHTNLCVGSNLILPGVLMGADYEYGAAAWIHTMPGFLDRPAQPFSPEHPYARRIIEILRGLAGVARDRAFLNPPVFLPPLSVVAELVGAEQFCLDLLERPADVHRAREAMTDLYIAAFEHFYREILKLGYGETACWLSAMAEGRLEAVQCDFAVMLSPDQFDEFVMPELRRLTEYLDFSLYHLDGACQTRFLPLLAQLPRLNGIQWNPTPGDKPILEWIDVFKEIRKQGWCMHFWCTVKEAIGVTRELGPDGLLFDISGDVRTVEDAERAMEEVKKVC